ncbi:MAG: hypothetical protein IPJ68_00545 [Candidatus Moraniibacteriota bacterium]|nr:MAG: hypothetical protein IPJ68_00545 [Candidatus Moranbacteria bacterium]
MASTLGTSVDLTTEVTGTLPVGNGGTGAATLASNGVLYGNGTGIVQVTTAGTTGQFLVANGSGVPTFVSLSSDVTISNAGVATIAADAVALTTDTTGNYVANVANGNGITGGSAGSEGASLTLTLDLLDSADGTGSTSSNSGLEFQGASSNELALLQGCADNEILSWNNTTNVWQCATVSGVGGISGTGTSGHVAFWTGTSSLSSEAQLSVSRGGTGLDGSAAANGTLLIGNGTGYTLATLTDGTGISITEGAGTITVASTLGTSIAAGEVDADSLDFTEFQDTLDLDAALTLNQTTNTWAQTFTGTTTTGFAYTATSLTTGSALNLTTTNTATANTALTPVSFNLTNAQSTLANTNGVTGLAVNFTNNPSVAGNSEYAVRIQNQDTNNTTDNALSALLLLDNADTTTSGTTIVTDAIAITNSGGSNFTTFLNTPTLDISAAGAITGATGITSSGNITFSSLTANSFLYSGTGGLLTTTSAPTNGQLLIGSTGVAPVAAALTQGAGITVTNGAGSITIASTLGTSVDGSEITDNTVEEVDLEVTNAPTGGYVLTYDAGTGGFTWVDAGGLGNSKWTDSGTLTYLTQTSDDVAFGGSTTTSARFVFDVTTGNQILFEGTGADDANETTLVITNPTADRTITLPNLTGTVATIDGGQTFTSATWNGTAISAQYGGTGLDGSAAANGTLLIGNGSGYTLATLTDGTGITISEGAGSITIASTLGTSVDLASEVTGTLPVGNGGTGATTFTSNGVLYGNGTGAVQVTAAGTSAQLLVANGSGVPTFVTLSSDATISNAGVLTVAADAVALTTDTTGNYVANAQTSVLTGLTGGSAGSEGASLTLGLDYSQALTGDVGLAANAGVFGQSGFAFEGSTANTIETYLVISDPTTTDKTITFPDASGTVAVSGSGGLSVSALGDITCSTCVVSGGTLFTAAGTSGSNQTIAQGDTLTIAAGTGITTTGGATDTITIASTLGTSISAGEVDADSLDFTEFQDTLDLDAALTLNQTTNTWAQTFTGTTTTGFAYTADALTSGSALTLASAAAALTGSLETITLSGSNAANTGSLLDLQNTGTANANTSLLIQHNATGTGNLAFRVNDVASDTSPFVIDGTGNVGIGTAAPSLPLHVSRSTGGTYNKLAGLYVPDITTGQYVEAPIGRSETVRNRASWSFLYDGDGSANNAMGLLFYGDSSARITALASGNFGIGDTSPASLFTVGDGDAFQVNSTGAIVAATGIISSGTITFSGFTSNGGVLYTNGSGTLAQATAGTSTQVLLGGATPSFGTIGASSVTADSLDFTEFQDTLDLDANLTLNQTTNTWAQSFTGTTTTGFAYTADALTSGYAETLNVNGAAVLTTGGALNIDGPTGAATMNTTTGLLNISSTGAITNSTTGAGSGSLFQVTGNGAITPTLASISDTSVMTTTGKLLDLTADAATTTTGLLTMNAAGLTTGYAQNINVNGAAVLTSGGAINIVGPTGAAAQAAGALLKITTTGAVTGTAGTGNSLQVTSGTVTGTVASITDAAVMTTTGSLLTLTGNSATTTTGLLQVNANALTSGSAVNIASSSVAFTGSLESITLSGSNAANTGNLLLIADTGALNTTTSFKVTANGAATQVAALIENTGSGTSFRVNDVASDTDPFLIDASGQVGIGDATPNTILDVLSSGAADTIFTLANTNAGDYDPVVKFELTEGTPLFTLGIDDSDSDKFKIYSGDGLASGDEFVIDASGTTTIANLNLGATSFDENAGAVTWIDMPVTSAATSGTVESYTAAIDGTSFLTVYAQSNGSGGLDTAQSAVKSDVELDATVDGLATKVNAGACSDTTFTRDTNGTICVDSTNGRIYFRYGGAWHYSAQTAGFQIPSYETAPLSKLTSDAETELENALPFDTTNHPEYLTQRLQAGEFLIPYVDEYLEDGAVHGLYARFGDVKSKLFGEEQQQIADLSLQTTANITTLSELQTSVDEQLLLASTNLTAFATKDTEIDAKLAEHDTYFARDLARLDTLDTLTAQIALDQNTLAANLTSIQSDMVTLTAQVGTLTEFFNAFDLGNMIAKDELGNVDLLGGALRAKSLATGGITIEVSDAEAPTIGTATVLPVVTDTDGDGKDDETGSDGRSIEIRTKAMIPMVNGSRIFTSFKGNPNAFSWVEKVRDGDGDYVGFKIRLSEKVDEAVKVDWWLIEQKDTFSAATP